MTNKFEVGKRAAIIAAFVTFAFLPADVSASPSCPQGMWSSRASCCELGSEYVANKNQCLPVRPERRCVEGHFDDCVVAGRQLEERGTIGAGYAAELYRYACDQGHAPACRGLGVLYERGLGVERDAARGRALKEQACEGGDAPACTAVASQMMNEESRETHALSLFAQACHRGDPYACGEYGAQLTRRPDQAKQGALYLERACVGGIASACRTLLTSVRGSRSVDATRERELLDRACRASDAESCLELGDGFRAGSFGMQSSAQAALRYRAACESGLLTGCVRLAELMASGDGVTRDVARASELYGKACGAGVKAACERASELRSPSEAARAEQHGSRNPEL